ncbi:hypothetical protein [Salinirussus salinus]|jgi:hypothetical protein|uniref:hypothetical protein n=1 Tax=Salinirussus salinus TaxID=1198300 RepID=UPI00135C859D|nr:hypothetical protein [Salinirussus salinus]
MSETALPTVAVDRRVEVGASLLGILAVLGATYYTGQTGNPFPLFAATSALALVVLFVNSGE